MCYSAEAVANYFISKAIKDNLRLSNMHLQKLVFFAHAIYTKDHADDKKLLICDPIVAWQHGPVIQSLYHELKKYGNDNITEKISHYELSKDGKDSFVRVSQEVRDEIKEYLDDVWSVLMGYTTAKLRALSHAKDGAWYKTVEKYCDPTNDEEVRAKLPRNLTILDEVIRNCGR